eukprot:6263162-Pyramimonas_sp.AAC.1
MQCQKDLADLANKLDKQIQDKLNPRLDELRREFTTKFDMLSAIAQSVDGKVECHSKQINEPKESVKQFQEALAVANQKPSAAANQKLSKPISISSASKARWTIRSSKSVRASLCPR